MTGYPKNNTFQIIHRSFGQQFDDIYSKEITKRYDQYEIQRLTKRKDKERKMAQEGYLSYLKTGF